MAALIWATLLWVGIVFAAAWLAGILFLLWLYHKFKNKTWEDDIDWGDDVTPEAVDIMRQKAGPLDTSNYVVIDGYNKKDAEYGGRYDRVA